MTIYTLQQTNFYICSFTQFTVIDCGDPPRLESGTLATPANTTYGSTVAYVCNEDYVFSEVSSETHTCLASGLWSDEDIECCESQIRYNHRYNFNRYAYFSSHNLFYSSLFPGLPFFPLTFSCSPSLNFLTPFSVVTCSGNLGIDVENGNVTYSQSLLEQGWYLQYTTATVSCSEGYTGGGVITCQTSGNWSPPSLPNCESEPACRRHLNYLWK